MVRLDAVGLRPIGGTGFNHIRIDRALYEEAWQPKPARLFFKDADKKLPDDTPFLLRIDGAAQAAHEPVDCIDNHHLYAKALVQRRLDLRHLTQAQQASIDKDSNQLLPHCALYHRSSDAGVYTAADR